MVRQTVNSLGSARVATPIGVMRGALVITTLPALTVLLSIVLVVSLTAFILAAQVGVRTATAHPNPFTDFSAFFPGQPISTSNTDYCQPPNQPYNSYSPTGILCSIFPQGSFFYMVQIWVKGNQVNEITFFSSELPSEALMAYWGQPISMQRMRSGLTYKMTWDNGFYTATAVVLTANRVAHIVMLTAK